MHLPVPDWTATALLASGLAFLGLSYFADRRGRLPAAAGWVQVGAYWPLLAPQFVAIGDLVNAAFTVLALPFFGYLAYHEVLSHVRGDHPESLRWLAGASFMAGSVYLLFSQWLVAGRWLITTVAEQTVWLLNLTHPGYTMGAFTTVGSGSAGGGAGAAIGAFSGVGGSELAPGYVPIDMTNSSLFLPGTISIILACTAIQAMTIFGGAIAAAPAAGKRKALALLSTVPTIYGLNLLRNWGIIYGVDVLAISFETMHNWVGKGGSLLALIGLAVLTFELLPEVHETVLGLIDLPGRDGPLERTVARALGRPDRAGK